MAGAVRSLLDWLARMGLSVRDDPPKIIDLAGRQWGPERDGFALSLAQRDDIVSVILRNVAEAPAAVTAPAFESFFRLNVEGAKRTAFGRKLDAAENFNTRKIQLAPGESVEAELPVETIYRLTRNFPYSIEAACGLPSGNNLVSNRIVFVLKQ